MSSEKCIRQLPPVRITDSCETALMRLAARDERSLSEYIRKVLERHAFGHAAMLPMTDEEGYESRAQHRSADALGGLAR